MRMTGIAARTITESRGLVTTIITAAPRNMIRLRIASDALEPKAALIWVVSAVKRERISPDLALS